MHLFLLIISFGSLWYIHFTFDHQGDIILSLVLVNILLVSSYALTVYDAFRVIKVKQ